MNKLLNFINSLDQPGKDEFSAGCLTSIGYFRKAISKGSLLSPALCVLVENHSKMKVTRKDLRPDDWQAIWPELIEAA